MKRRVVQAAVMVVVLLALAAPVLANSSFWSYRMHELVVSGERNGVFHQMTAGVLTNRGQIWVESHDPPPFPPDRAIVRTEVWKDNGWWGDFMVCRISIRPRDDGVATAFQKNCGDIAAGQYYIYAWKDFQDGRNIGAQGDLITP